MLFTDICHRDGMAFDTGIHFFPMLAGLIRVGAVLTDSAGFSSEDQLIIIFAKNIGLDLLHDFDMFASGCQHFVHIENVTDLGDGAENKGMIITQATLFAFFQGTNRWRTGPGVPVLGTFQLTDAAHRIIKINF